ncbi:MAG: SpoIIE family protein phosphatase [Anaerolineae bacterium]|jgi:sigma-B regulation protein RsbU (phosphoserine phosphatase)|nr:SpoIIE family protein phosphatase [Anaerolineae bacterium]
MRSDPARPATDRLSLLYHVSQSFNSSLDLDLVLNRVMDQVVELMRAERGFVMLLEDDGAPVFRVARGMDHQTIEDPEFQISRGVVERVAREGEPLLTSNAQTDDRLSLRVSVQALGLRSILCVPLKVQDRITGVIYVDNRLQAGLFTPDDLELLSSIAHSAAIAIENARLYRVAVEKGRMEREMQVARELQASLLPRTTPQVPGWEFAAAWQPARQTSGDYYDFFAAREGEVGLVIGDVSGKGMPAALFMALTRSIVRASLAGPTGLVERIERANRLICADSTAGMFVTLFCAEIRLATGEVTYVNAGHNPPLLLSGGVGDDRLEELHPTGMALGILEDAPFQQQTVQMAPGELLLLYTDGVPDATQASGERFEMPRLRRLLLEEGSGTAQDVLSTLAGSVAAFTGTCEQFDDMAMVVTRRLAR